MRTQATSSTANRRTHAYARTHTIEDGTTETRRGGAGTRGRGQGVQSTVEAAERSRGPKQSAWAGGRLSGHAKARMRAAGARGEAAREVGALGRGGARHLLALRRLAQRDAEQDACGVRGDEHGDDRERTRPCLAPADEGLEEVVEQIVALGVVVGDTGQVGFGRVPRRAASLVY